jgi:long-chain acyl-CoA synthetase
VATPPNPGPGAHAAGQHADTTGLGPHLAALTAPGAEFALVERDVGGARLRLYDRAPPTLREMILATAALGDRPFLIYRDERYDYAEHLRLARALAARFTGRFGLRPGDRVAIAMRNYPEWSITFWATQLAGLVATPLNAWWSAAELTWAVGHVGARLVVADAERAALLTGDPAESGVPAAPGAPAGTGDPGESGALAAPAAPGERESVPVIRVRGTGPSGALDWAGLGLDGEVAAPEVEVAPTDPSTIFFTSGTTGRPKGAVHTHLNHVTNAHNVLLLARAVARSRATERPAARPPAAQPPAAQPPDGQPGTLLTYPLFHIAGLNALYGAVLSGAKLATQYRWDAAEAVELIREHRLTGAAGVPTTMAELAEAAIAHPGDAATLARIGVGGAPVPPGLVTRIRDGLGPATYAANGYGSTETTSAVCANSADDFVRHPDSVGRLAPGADLRVVDPDTLRDVPDGGIGELWFRGPNIIPGYWADPEATGRAIVDGWLRSGDLGRTADGWVYVLDRLKDVVIRGGENVYSSQVESVLLEVDGVLEAAVFGRPHPRLGEEVCAAVRLAPGTPRDAAALAERVTRRLAPFAAPTHVVWFDGPLPRTATGKVIKRGLRG